MTPHFIVIRFPVSSDHLPNVEHVSLDEAKAEAMRLSKKHPTYAFRIYAVVGEARSTVATEFYPTP